MVMIICYLTDILNLGVVKVRLNERYGNNVSFIRIDYVY